MIIALATLAWAKRGHDNGNIFHVILDDTFYDKSNKTEKRKDFRSKEELHMMMALVTLAWLRREHDDDNLFYDKSDGT